MIGQIITDDKGNPLDNKGNRLSESNLVYPKEVKDFFLKFQRDYQVAWNLQRKPLDEFDGISLLERAKLDQETFAAFVGVEYQPVHKRWRWRGRKNTARNKLIGILAHMIAGMLFPFVYAQNERDEEDKMTARVMRILVEEHLKRAKYDIKFLYLTLSALVNPAVFAHIEYVEVIQKIKQRMKDGRIEVLEAIDEIMSGTQLYIKPIDEVLLGDLYSGTGNIHAQPNIFLVRRITWDAARGEYAGKYTDSNGKDLFDYVQAGKTRVMTADENHTLYDVEWDEADGNFVQVVKGLYRSEDLEIDCVGGVLMCNWKDIYNSNPFEHRRMTKYKDSWITVPVYSLAMSGFEPLDPAGRFVYYKSGAFKEYWEDKKITEMDRLLVDGVKLDVIKPTFLSGAAQFDSKVMVPGATVFLPRDASVTPYSLGPNLAGLYKVIQDGAQDMSESTQDKVMQGITEKGITATQTNLAKQQARVFLGVFGLMMADLVRQIGELTMDCIIQYTTVGELDATVPESLKMKFHVVTAKGKEKGKDITNRIMFTNRYTGKNPSKEEVQKREWELYNQAGGEKTDQFIYEVDPYRFVRSSFSMFVDADQIILRSMGADRAEKDLAFERLMDPRVMPFINPQAVVDDFVIEPYSDGDPDKYKAKQGQEEMIQALMGLMQKPDQKLEQRSNYQPVL